MKRRSIEVFSLSFLDCLCCGFGAILLLFILSIGSGRAGIESEVDTPTLQALRQQLSELEAHVAEKASLLEASINHVETAQERQRINSLIQEMESQLADLQQEYDARQANLSTGQQAAAEATRLLRSFQYEDLPPIGLPTDATHVAFVIDTSGSMRNRVTGQLHYSIIEQITSLLDSLPQVQSIQFIDASGNYMLPGRAGFWLPDTPGLRQQALRAVLNFPGHSVSHPEPGIRQAFRDLRPSVQSNERMSLYVIGDDFHGSTERFLVQMDRLNPADPRTGERAASISGVGFPTMINMFQFGAQHGNIRFANAMREVAHEHHGVLILKPRI